MLVRSYSKTNNLVADDVISTLKQQYPQRQWVASSKLSSEEVRGLNSQFGIGEQLPTLPEATELPQEPIEPPQAEFEEMRSPESPIEPPEENQPPSDDQPAGQIQQAPQQLPLAQQSPSEMAQAIQFLLTQQQSLGYSSELKAESAALDGASDAYREFIAYQSGYNGTAQGLHQLAQTLDELKYKASTDGFGQNQKDFLSHLRHNSETSQAAKTQHTQRVQSLKNQTNNNITSMQDAVLNAIKDLNA